MSEVGDSTVLEQLSANVLDTRFADIDQSTVDNAKNRIIDSIGCVISGAKAPGTPALVRLVRNWGGKREATILVHGYKVPAPHAAMVNCVMCRSFDFQPMSLRVLGKGIPCHITGTTVMTAVTLGGSELVDGKELIAALVAGDDFAARVYAGSDKDWVKGFEHFDSSGTVAAFGATAIASRLLGLNHSQARNAFGIVINQLTGAGAGIWGGSTIFKLSQGTSARNGIFSAELAKAGWIGVKDPLFGKGGYYKAYTHGCDHLEFLTGDLGKKYHVECDFKRYPGGKPTSGPTEAALALVNKHGIEADEIEEVTLLLSPPTNYGHYAKPFNHNGDFPSCEALFNYRYAVASALVRKSSTPRSFLDESIDDPRIRALIDKIELADLAKPEGIELKIKMKDGRELSQYVDCEFYEHIPPRRPPMSRDEIVAKFWSQIEFSQTVRKQNAERLLKYLERLEEVENVDDIVKLAVRD